MASVRKCCAALAVSLLALAFHPFAKALDGDHDDLLYPSGLQVGLELGHLDYDEPDVMELKGTMLGINGSLTHVAGNRSVWSVEGRAAFGDIEYDGETWGGTPITRDSADYILEIRGLFGWHLPNPGGYRLTPFAGLGYRYWNNQIEGPGSYEREIHYLYSPLGLEYARRFDSKWAMSVSGEYDLFWSGGVESHLSDAGAGLPDVTNDQNSGSGFRTSWQLRRVLAKSVVSFGLVLRYWDIADSERAFIPGVGYVIEPANHTLEIAVPVSVEW